MSYKEIWDTLSKLDCSKYVEKKQNLSYISWANALAILMDHYPEATWEYTPDLWLDNRTVEVGCTITIGECKRHMTLPVMDYKMKAIADPTSRDISDARMRCWVKCVALFGLGLYLYRGQDLPQAEQAPDPMQLHLEAVANNMESIQYIKNCLADGEYSSAYEAFQEISEADRNALWMAPTKGGKAWTTKEIAQFKSNEWGEARKLHHGEKEADQ